MTPDSPAYAIRNTIASPDYNVFHRAPALIIICSKPGGLLPLEDCCFAAQNLVLAAQALGLGTCPVGFARPWLSLAEVKRELGIPEDCVPAVPIILGYPGQDPPPPGRRPAEIIALGSPVPSGAASYALQPA
jgi:nitroreductase